MPILNSNERYTREVVQRLSVLTGLPTEAVRSVIDGLELCMLEDIRKAALEVDTSDKNIIQLELPKIGTLKLSTSRYPSEKSVMLDGKSFRSSFNIYERFLTKLRWAYYGKYDYLTERSEANFRELFKDHYKSIITEEGEE